MAVGIAAWHLCDFLSSAQKAAAVYKQAQVQYFQTDSGSADSGDASAAVPSIDWATIQSDCPDVIGWLYCPGTKLNYPIVQARDNAYYLTRLYTGKPDAHGAIFADCRSGMPLSEANTLIYGHNMHDGSMFHCLINWGSADYAAAHPVIYILTPNGSCAVRIFSAYLTEPDSETYTVDFSSVNKAAWLSACARQSFFTADFAPDTEDHIVTFSTCSGDRRFVVQGAAHAAA